MSGRSFKSSSPSAAEDPRVKELIHVKSIVDQSPRVGLVLKFGEYKLKCLLCHLSEPSGLESDALTTRLPTALLSNLGQVMRTTSELARRYSLHIANVRILSLDRFSIHYLLYGGSLVTLGFEPTAQ
ncbi:hypothetical protein TNCV_3632531 [Trichonephila clavipes]|nr:hypothetical protein TNCV_3632531 [Trichonephila clavipes]